jgi:hypothetical protein
MLSAVVELFPSTLFRMGGDEINARCYADDAQTQHDIDGRTLEQALNAYTQATHGAQETWQEAGCVGRGDLRMALPQLHEVGYRFRRRGMQAISLQPEWCALHPFAYDLNA